MKAPLTRILAFAEERAYSPDSLIHHLTRSELFRSK